MKNVLPALFLILASFQGEPVKEPNELYRPPNYTLEIRLAPHYEEITLKATVNIETGEKIITLYQTPEKVIQNFVYVTMKNSFKKLNFDPNEFVVIDGRD